MKKPHKELAQVIPLRASLISIAALGEKRRHLANLRKVMYAFKLHFEDYTT